MLADGLLWQASKSGILRQPNGEDHGHNELGTWSGYEKRTVMPHGVECSCNDLGSRSLLRPISIPFACGASTGQAFGLLPWRHLDHAIHLIGCGIRVGTRLVACTRLASYSPGPHQLRFHAYFRDRALEATQRIHAIRHLLLLLLQSQLSCILCQVCLSD